VCVLVCCIYMCVYLHVSVCVFWWKTKKNIYNMNHQYTHTHTHTNTQNKKMLAALSRMQLPTLPRSVLPSLAMMPSSSTVRSS
jgi:hypothetical protein